MDITVGDRVRVKGSFGWGLNRAFRRACTARRQPVVKQRFKDAVLLEVIKGTAVLSAWVNVKEVEAI